MRGHSVSKTRVNALMPAHPSSSQDDGLPGHARQ
jgi:hypothetical protein